MIRPIEDVYLIRKSTVRHSICNDCLDGLVVFQKDGSGILPCLRGCYENIKIGANDSVVFKLFHPK